MWIRSQDKEILTKCENVFVAYDNSNYFIKSFMQDKIYFTLGSYSSKEKAMKVLNMIEERTRVIQSTSYRAYTQGYLLNLGVFQMPHDDEVEY